MPQPTSTFIDKVTTNQRKLERLRYKTNKDVQYRKTKVCHSLIHNLVEAYDKYGNTKAGDWHDWYEGLSPIEQTAWKEKFDEVQEEFDRKRNIE